MSRRASGELVALLLALSGCNSRDAEAVSAEKQYQMVVAAKGSPSEKCAAATRAADAWLKRENKQKYEDWVLQRNIDCLNMRLAD